MATKIGWLWSGQSFVRSKKEPVIAVKEVRRKSNDEPSRRRDHSRHHKPRRKEEADGKAKERALYIDECPADFVYPRESPGTQTTSSPDKPSGTKTSGTGDRSRTESSSRTKIKSDKPLRTRQTESIIPGWPKRSVSGEVRKTSEKRPTTTRYVILDVNSSHAAY